MSAAVATKAARDRGAARDVRVCWGRPLRARKYGPHKGAHLKGTEYLMRAQRAGQRSAQEIGEIGPNDQPARRAQKKEED